MDSIDHLGAHLAPSLTGRPKEKKAEKVKKSEFSRYLGKAAVSSKPEDIVLPEEITEEFLIEALDEVTQSGDELKKKPTLVNIKKYRTAVAIFIKAVIAKSMDVDEKTSGLNILKRKKYTLVQVVDQKLNSLAAEILGGQSGQLQILERVDEIRGILVDLMK
jgi:uncharacterized protein YaaR (DUF327 family)